LTLNEHDEKESFEFFHARVMQLCSARFPNATFRVEPPRGGSYNRITDITVTPLHPRKWSFSWMHSFLIFHEGHVRPQEPKEHILRSRQTEISSDDLDMNYDMSTVKFALMVLGDIVSDIVLLNEQPHTIQNRLLGQTLLSVWLWLSKNQNEYDEMIAADEPAETYLRRLKSS
jgi:hypothetical protein